MEKISADGRAETGERKGRDAHGLTYPFDAPPEPGTTREIVPGIHWLRMPLPFALDHINLWLLEEEEGWTIVDTGVDSSLVRGYWEQIFETVLKGKPVTRVIVTHLHPDHVGLAGWLTRKWQTDLWMSRTDYLLCKTLVLDTGRPAPDEAIRFYRAAGFNDRQLEAYRKRFGGFGERVSQMPDQFHRLQDGDELQIGGRVWRVVVGSGHAPEHICLHCPDLKVFLSGDQVLPRISSNVSVHPTEPFENPLQDWIDSCARLRAGLPDDVLVLPAHNLPFFGLHNRLTSLIDGHEHGLKRLTEVLAQPKRAVDVFSALFKRRINSDLFFMATGESLAHLNCLLARGVIRRELDADGVNWYQTI